jgi:opacity protein-like surface antigen
LARASTTGRHAGEDQNVFAFGAEYDVIDMIAVRAGYNYGKSTVLPKGINPLFGAISEHHATGGLGIHDFGVAGLAIDLAFEYSPATTVKSDAANQMAYEPSMPGATPSPNGYALEVSMSQMTFHVGARYDF